MSTVAQQDDGIAAAAVGFAAAGRVVFPVDVEAGKRPRVRWGQLQPGPWHELQVRCWWRKWRDAGIGLRTGDGLAVIDIDPRHGGQIDPSWPATLTARTRSGGWHLYYRAAVPVRCSAGVVAPGVDVRGEGGFVVAPPTPGWSWLNDAALAELPRLRAEERGASGRRMSGTTGTGQRFEILDEVAEGGRNQYLARMVGWLLSQGIGPDDAEALVEDYNAVACKPPLDCDEVSAIVASIARYHR